jgi:UDP-N-acetylmuramyl pentapeptide phosphotransferase/UDP-N-acetylglucosamine-1-phosphate transferase
MSAPDTNTEKTKAAHKTPITGMIGMVVFAVVLLIALVAWLSFAGNDPEDEAGVENGISTVVTEGTAAEGAATE